MPFEKGAKTGAKIGNKNAAKGREWLEAIRLALRTYESDSIKRGMALRRIAETVVEKAIAGDKDAWAEIGNRLDGKPVQGIEGNLSVDQSGTVTHEHVAISEVSRRIAEVLDERTERTSPPALPN